MDGGRPRVCVKLAGVESCKNRCLGSSEGENAPICYRPGSLPPSVPKNSLIDTCAKDDLGTLYSESTVENICTGTCDEASGLCI